MGVVDVRLMFHREASAMENSNVTIEHVSIGFWWESVDLCPFSYPYPKTGPLHPAVHGYEVQVHDFRAGGIM